MSTSDPQAPDTSTTSSPSTDTPHNPPQAPQAPAQDAPAASTPSTPPPASEAPASSPSSPSSDDLKQQLDAMAAEIAQLREQTSTGQLSITQTDEQLAEKVKSLRGEFEDWPQRGGNDKPQPWDLKGHELPAPGVTRDYLPAGQPDELSPVVIAHNKPLLAPGTAGAAVEELAGLLHALGYESSISKGQNHAMAFDDTVAAAVGAFRRDFHVAEDPSQFPAQGTQHETVVGPWLWEALLRAVKLEKAA